MGMTSQHAADGRRTVLVVDDEALVRDLVEELLVDEGYRVVAVPDAAAAEAAAAREPVLDALVVDVVLPGGGGGAELAARVRSTHPAAGVVLVSGYAPDEGELPADVRFLQKPFSAVQLRDALAAALEGRDPPA
jgi:CheY-like chemotaxis protein